MIISLKEVDVNYEGKNTKFQALKKVSLEVEEGEFLVIMGKSGCGKSTLLNVLGAIRKSDDGTYLFDGKEVQNMKDGQLAKFRNHCIGFVVQHFALLNDKTVADNIALPLEYMRISKKEQKDRVDEVLKSLEIEDMKWKYPSELSGGQQQRVAIARALVTRPRVLLADEPTGALDEETGKKIMELLCEINRAGTTIIMVTHDSDFAKWGSRCINMKDGVIIQS